MTFNDYTLPKRTLILTRSVCEARISHTLAHASGWDESWTAVRYLLLGRRDMLQHLATSFFALHALLSAFLHVRIVGEFIAFFRTRVATIGAGLTDDAGHWPAARDDLGRRRTYRCTVLAMQERRDVVFFALVKLMGTVGAAQIALELAGRTGLGARLEGGHMFFMVNTFRWFIFRLGEITEAESGDRDR